VPYPVGVTEVNTQVAGVTRHFSVVVPAPPAATTPTTAAAAGVPAGAQRSVLIVLHGVGGRGAAMRGIGFEPLAAPSGSIIVYPDALGGSWNDGRPGLEPLNADAVTDDVAFIRTMIDDVVARTGVSPQHVGVAGFSNGAFMASRAACELSDKISGIALVGGTAGQNYSQVCKPSRWMPMVEVHGTSDPVVPYAGGRVADNQGHRRGMVLSVGDFLGLWAGGSHCTGTKETSIKAALPVTMVEGQACQPGSPVVHYRVTGGVHEWFRVQGFDTTKVTWDFLATNAFAT
jgi:polyhydroxybutyrate depolymerase